MSLSLSHALPLCRYYRAPELIFGATDYTTAIDVWSVGCVVAELMLGQPLFPGESGVDQLVEIIKVLGTPTKEEIHAMNPNYTEFKFPQIKAHPWSKVFSKKMPAEAIDLVSSGAQRPEPVLLCHAQHATAGAWWMMARGIAAAARVQHGAQPLVAAQACMLLHASTADDQLVARC